MSQRKILALGKLKRRKQSKIIIWAVKKIENSNILLFKFTYNKTEFIINKWMAKSPLKPSIRFAPFTINKKHKSTKIVEKILLSNHELKKIRSIFLTSIDNRFIKIIKDIIININLIFELTLFLISSK